MKSVFVVLSVAAAALAAPQFETQRTFAAPQFAQKQIVYQKPAAPQFTYQRAAEPQFVYQKATAAPQFVYQKATAAPQFAYQKATAAPQYAYQKSAQYAYQRSSDPQYYAQRAAAAPTIVNFGLERTHPDQGELIIRQTQTHDADGTYSLDLELEKGIKMSEQGYLKNAGSDAEAQSVQGQFSYVGDDGQTYTVSYIADENGFQPQGAHLPTPPPIPAELERAFAIARADPNYKETDEQ